MHDLVLPEEYLLLEGENSEHRVVLIGSDTLGSGDDELGRMLMLRFLDELSTGPLLPAAIVLYNGGVRFVAAGSAATDDLCTLERHGTDILVCALSLERQGTPQPLPAGRAASMSEITDCLMKATTVIRP